MRGHKKIFAVIIFVGSVFFFVLGLVRVKSNIGNSIKISAYFPNQITNLIESEERKIVAGTEKNVLERAVYILYDGPKSKNLSAFPISELKILNISFDENKTAVLNFSDEYKKITAYDELFFRSSLVWTLTSLDFVDNVHIFVNSQELKKSDGSDMNLLSRNNVIINPEISDEKTNLQLVKLYFRDENKLVAEDRMININPSQPIEKYILEQIISGPINSNLLASVASDTKIRDIKTDENICYVSLSDDFLNKNNDYLALYSIINSLTELENISKVQFLIESEKTSQSSSNFDLSKPFERNEKIIRQGKK